MPNNYEPIDAHVSDDEVHVGPASLSPGSSSAPGGIGTNSRGTGAGCGCLVIPAVLGLSALAMGIYQITGWQVMAPAARLGAVILMVFGLAVTLAVVAVIWLILRLRRLVNNLQRDAVRTFEQLQYMANQGRPPRKPAQDASDSPVVDGPELLGAGSDEPPEPEAPDDPPRRP